MVQASGAAGFSLVLRIPNSQFFSRMRNSQFLPNAQFAIRNLRTCARLQAEHGKRKTRAGGGFLWVMLGNPDV
ncbi:hypothetical protein [Serratia fonticola]